MDVLQRVQMRGSDEEESCTHPSQLHATNTVGTWGSQRRRRFVSSHLEEHFDGTESPISKKTPRIEDLVEMVRKWIDEDKSHFSGGPRSLILRIYDSPLLEKIMSHGFKEVCDTEFHCYTEATGPIQHLRTYQVKITVHSHDDYLISQASPSSLQGLALDWFYSLPSCNAPIPQIHFKTL